MKTVLTVILAFVASASAAETQKYAWDESIPRFRTSEYILTGASLAGAAATFFWVEPPKSPSWKRQILFDAGARNTLLIHSAKTRNRASNITEVLTYSVVGYGMLDGPVTEAARQNKDAAVQLALINAETFAVTEVLNLGVSKVVARSRPPGDVCDPNARYDQHCSRSFYSGHTANAFAAASLVCAEHRALGTYGGAGDTAACAASLAAATAVGVLRIATNDHHASDVLVGAAIGGATGYLMPNLLHFQFRKSERDLGYLIPSVGPTGGGLTYVKAW